MRMPGAKWIGPTGNRVIGGQQSVRGLVLHIQQGTEAGTESWFHNPAAKASAHFLNPKRGPLLQLVDTADRAWAQANGNLDWISVENEGLSGESLTGSQIANCAALYAWLHTEYLVPLIATNSPAGYGLGWHGMGGAAWGGHPDCPGSPVIAQRAVILDAAARLLRPPAPVPAHRKAQPMVILHIQQSTVPADLPWPGDMLVGADGTLICHVQTPDDITRLTAAGVPGPIVCTYAEYTKIAGK